MGGCSIYRHLHEGGIIGIMFSLSSPGCDSFCCDCEGCPAATLLLWAIAPELVDPWASGLFQRFHLDIALSIFLSGVHNDIFFMLAMQHHVLRSYEMLILLMKVTTLKLNVLPFMETLKFYPHVIASSVRISQNDQPLCNS